MAASPCESGWYRGSRLAPGEAGLLFVWRQEQRPRVQEPRTRSGAPTKEVTKDGDDDAGPAGVRARFRGEEFPAGRRRGRALRVVGALGLLHARRVEPESSVRDD